MKQRLITLALLLAILLLSIKLVQQFRTLHPLIRHITFTCAVGVQGKIGQVCIQGDAGAQLHVTITYCNHQGVSSPTIIDQERGTNEYRWIWQVLQPMNCAGKPANAQALARWADGSQAGAKAIFPIASPMQGGEV
jgi:hypothetical protein